jgi:hypothetical protein
MNSMWKIYSWLDEFLTVLFSLNAFDEPARDWFPERLAIILTLQSITIRYGSITRIMAGC